MSRGKAPSLQWYPGDWQRDFGVRSCSLAARGLWREMLDVMHDGDPRGTMQVGQKIINDPAEIAALVSAKPGEDVAALLVELESTGVFSRNEAGAIYSRRMVRDTHISEVRRASGSEGGKVAQAKVRGKIEEPPAVADAEAESMKQEVPLPANLDTPAFRSAWSDWHSYRRERNLGKWVARTVKTKLAELAAIGEPLAIQSIRTSISNGWQGLILAKTATASAPTCFRCGGKGVVTLPEVPGSCAVYNPETGRSERPILTEPCPRCAGRMAA